MKAPKTKPEYRLSTGRNAFAILVTAKRALKKAGADEEYINKYMDEATNGDFAHLLQVTMDYVDVYL